MLKKTLKTLITLILLEYISFSSILFAQTKNDICESNPPICSATPKSMNLYLEFQREAGNIIKNNPFKTSTEMINKGEGGLFSNKLLKIETIKKFDESLAGQLLKVSYISTAKHLTAQVTSILLFELSAYQSLFDNTANLTILLQDRPIVRDRTKLLDIEWELNKTAYHLGKLNLISKKIINTEAFKKIINKYKNQGLFSKDSNFEENISYIDLLGLLTSMNINIKSFLSYDTTYFLKKFETKGLTFDNQRIENIQNDYKCVRWNIGFKCNKSWNSLQQNFEQTINITQKKGISSWKQINESFKDLKKALSTMPEGILDNLKGESTDSYLNDREKQLLRDVYGIDTTSITKEEALSIIKLSSKTKDLWNEIKKGTKVGKEKIIIAANKIIRSLGKERNKNEEIKVINKQFNRNPKDIEEEIVEENELSTKRTNNLNIHMIKNLQELLISRQEVETIANTTENIALTHIFGEISSTTKKLINIVGNKEKNLRKTLYTTCTYQCSNKGNLGCYTP